MRKIGSVLLGILWAAVLTSCSAQTDGPQVTYTDTGVSCLVEGYDAVWLEWNYGVGKENEFLLFDKPNFLGPAFEDGCHYWGDAKLVDEIIHVSVTKAGDDPTGLGPTRNFAVDPDGVIVDASFWEGSISLTDEEIVQAAQTLRQIIEAVQDYQAAQGE